MLDGSLSAIHMTVAVVCMGVLATAAETVWLVARGTYEDDAFWPWPVIRESYGRVIARPVGAFASGRSMLAISLVRIACAIAVLVSYTFGFTATLPLVMLVLSHFVLTLRHRWGGEGGDQMTALVLIVGLIADIFVRYDTVVAAAAIFIGAQILLAYISSGVAKLFGPLWREGSALTKILSNHSHGHEWLSGQLMRSPVAARLICHAVMAFQLTFPLFLVLPTPAAYLYLIAGAAFHMGIAMFMRLNLFCFAFIGTYPCLIYTREVFRGWIGL